MYLGPSPRWTLFSKRSWSFSDGFPQLSCLRLVLGLASGACTGGKERVVLKAGPSPVAFVEGWLRGFLQAPPVCWLCAGLRFLLAVKPGCRKKRGGCWLREEEKRVSRRSAKLGLDWQTCRFSAEKFWFPSCQLPPFFFFFFCFPTCKSSLAALPAVAFSRPSHAAVLHPGAAALRCRLAAARAPGPGPC